MTAVLPGSAAASIDSGSSVGAVTVIDLLGRRFGRPPRAAASTSHGALRQRALQPLLGAGGLPGAVGDRHVAEAFGQQRRAPPDDLARRAQPPLVQRAPPQPELLARPLR